LDNNEKKKRRKKLVFFSPKLSLCPRTAAKLSPSLPSYKNENRGGKEKIIMFVGLRKERSKKSGMFGFTTQYPRKYTNGKKEKDTKLGTGE